MPNHFHLLVKQNSDGSISKFISDVLNALTRTFNIHNKRKGPLFLPRFQARLMANREQLIHVSRYIHLNPFSAQIIHNNDEILSYPWSSMKDYVYISKQSLSQTDNILDEFNQDNKKYIQFVLNNADYQKNLEYVKYSEKW